MHLLVVAFADYSLDVISHLHVEFIQGVTHVLDKRGQDILFVSGQFAWHTTRYDKARLMYAVGQGEVWGTLFTPSQCFSRISAESLSNAKALVASASDWNRTLGRSARRERKHSRKE